MSKLLFHIPIWIMFETMVNIPLILLGWIVVPINAALGLYKLTYDEGKARKGENPNVYHFTCPFMYLWDNMEKREENTLQP